MSDEDWPLTDERIGIVLDEIRAHPCPQSACCLTDEERTSFALYAIGEKALTDLLRLRAMERRFEQWVKALNAQPSDWPLSAPVVAAEVRRRMASEPAGR
jgi:hypothetical protein